MADTTVLSNFAQVRRPDLLVGTFQSLIVPDLVREELRRGEELELIPKCDWNLEFVALTQTERIEFDRLRTQVDPGEAACIAIAMHRAGLVLTDDRAARRLATQLELKVSGTLGILLRLHHQHQRLSLESADDLLTRMIQAGYRSPVQSLLELA